MKSFVLYIKIHIYIRIPQRNSASINIYMLHEIAANQIVRIADAFFVNLIR